MFRSFRAPGNPGQQAPAFAALDPRFRGDERRLRSDSISPEDALAVMNTADRTRTTAIEFKTSKSLSQIFFRDVIEFLDQNVLHDIRLHALVDVPLDRLEQRHQI